MRTVKLHATHFEVCELPRGKLVRMARVLTFRDRALQSKDAIELLSNKWRITILHLLRDEPLRTSELQNAIVEISAKVLTETLRGMERDGLVRRKVHTVVPP